LKKEIKKLETKEIKKFREYSYIEQKQLIRKSISSISINLRENTITEVDKIQDNI